MKTLLVLRHAKASHDDSAPSDHQRPLTKRGLKAAKAMGELARDEELVPALVLSSTAERARSTAEEFVQGAGYTGEVMYLDELYLAEPKAYVDALKRLAANAESVLVIGHNPGLEALVFRLTGQTERIPTAALLQCVLPIDAWSELGSETSGELRKVFRPKELD